MNMTQINKFTMYYFFPSCQPLVALILNVPPRGVLIRLVYFSLGGSTSRAEAGLSSTQSRPAFRELDLMVLTILSYVQSS